MSVRDMKPKNFCSFPEFRYWIFTFVIFNNSSILFLLWQEWPSVCLSWCFVPLFQDFLFWKSSSWPARSSKRGFNLSHIDQIWQIWVFSNMKITFFIPKSDFQHLNMLYLWAYHHILLKHQVRHEGSLLHHEPCVQKQSIHLLFHVLEVLILDDQVFDAWWM